MLRCPTLARALPLLCLPALLTPATALADDPTATIEEPDLPPRKEPLVTDRPDVAESSLTVGRFVFQAEVGADATLRGDTPTTVVFPLKLRQGISETFEFHIETDTFAISAEESGLTAPDIGSKWHIGHSDNGRWSLGLLTALSIPLNEDQGYVFSPTAAFDVGLSDRFGLGINIGTSIFLSPRITDLDEMRFATSLGAGWTDAFGTYLELFGSWQFSNQWALSADTGVTYKLSPNLQLDGYVRQGFLNANDTGVGAGVSFRL